MKNTVKTALLEEEITYNILEDHPERLVIKFGINLDNGKFDTIIDVRLDYDQVLIFTVLPILVPKNKRSSVAEFVCLANYGIILGGFELDMKDGDLRYKNTYLFDSSFPNSKEIFLRNMFASFRMVDEYFPGIMSIIYANVDPAVAIHQIESMVDPSHN